MLKLTARNYRKFLNINNAQKYIETKRPAPLSNYYAYENDGTYKICDRALNRVGDMVAFPERIKEHATYYPDSKNYASLYVANLFVAKEHRGKGVGKALMNIAKSESQRRNCNGRVHLIAEHTDLSQPPPHIFYRKNGLASQDWVKIDKIDTMIDYGTTLTKNQRFPSIPMYLKLDEIYKNTVKNLESIFRKF